MTTRWTTVLAAGGATPEARNALEILCRTYWYPLYAYLRRSGSRRHDAEDLVQGFFAQIFRRNALGRVSREKGRFRSFLLASLKYYVADEHDRASAAKRGGGQTVVSIDANEAEQRYGLDPVDRLTPSDLFERQWALTLLDGVLSRLRHEQAESGRLELFDELKPMLHGDRDHRTYAEIAGRLGLSEAALKMSVHRLRRRLREILQEEVAQTVGTPGDVQAEMRHLLIAVAK